MVRPCFLVLDREHSGSISTRKLVIETAKFNVITAYSADEAIATLRKFPPMDGIVMDAVSAEIPCEELIRIFKDINAKVPVIAVRSPRAQTGCEGADYLLESFDPSSLLGLLKKICPDATAIIEKQNEILDAEGCD